MTRPLVLLFVLAVTGIGTAAAEIYRWTDESGKIHFSDRAPGGHAAETVQVRPNTYESVSYDKSIFDTGKQVVMYSTQWCGHCKIAKRYFRREGIPFTEYDIERNARARSDYERMGATGVPVILVGKERMNGFSEPAFERLYRGGS